MSDRQPSATEFAVSHGGAAGNSLVAGFSAFGLAGLTAVDYLVDHLELSETGHVTTDATRSITPFEDGTPRHHTRLFSDPDRTGHEGRPGGLTVLVNELFVPPFAADGFAGSILEWAESAGVDEVTVLAGAPVPHGPGDHQTYYVATEDYQAARVTDTDIPPMGRGFLDGINAGLVGRGLDSDLRVGVLVTPVHAQAPDVAAAVRLVEAAETVLGFDVETDALERFAAEIEEYYRELADRQDRMTERDTAEDRMFM